MRPSLAIDRPASVLHAARAALAALAGVREEFAGAVRWSAPVVIHLTVKFNCETAARIGDRLRERGAARIGRHEPFEARLPGGRVPDGGHTARSGHA